MRLVVERAPLLKALGHLNGIADRKATIPILGSVLLRAEGDALSLSATDMDIELVQRIPARVDIEGTAALAATLFDIVRKLKDGAQIEIAVEKSAVAVRSGRSSFSLSMLDARDYPVLSAGEMTHHFALSAGELRTLIDHTRFAISTEETRYYLGGIYLHATAGALRAVATDGHRLARVDVALPEGADGMDGIIVPRKTAIELRKMIDGDGEISISASKTKIRFGVSEAVMTSKVIDGTFPDYDRVIPVGNDKIAEVGRDDFAAAVDRVATISKDRTRAVRLSLSERTLNLLVRDSEAQSNATEDVDAAYDGAPLEVGFNARYLLDIVSEVEAENLQFSLKDGAGPAIIRGSGDSSTLFVLMPMRV